MNPKTATKAEMVTEIVALRRLVRSQQDCLTKSVESTETLLAQRDASNELVRKLRDALHATKQVCEDVVGELDVYMDWKMLNAVRAAIAKAEEVMS